ncbi:acyl-CoA dehydrogenase family protein [Pseudomonas sp. ZM23]|uniref:Acyl-CoA dehydrogenase family protein n=1 Tax=Pseudomonas triclosanedens TaxID=2961893 RepID=A0ABY7A3C8_9PSED|nr:acyl-CoA dehydrogenase family protein [Pseudomonas triclosanedens]MCP8465055.1 acyl-CoA dehydrogenase family protein [Pseudomonas triclosanedens]MCP8470233.1 acyl-CoA dehydrogenase family protein [Pseudomonas triclosanedens]MCP8476038.1 acyl-CoA dehydrogenase family protein [Pseudomonas triclosanedens]WAI51724.1 acyl-CoA dehydrogenase family protein [Pseudomonas triclosanedens]
MSQFADFTDVERDIVESVRKYIAKEVRPRVQELERTRTFPTEMVAAMKEMGLFGLAVPEEFGGLHLRLPVFAAVMEVIAAGWTTLAAYINSHGTVAYAITRFGTQEQKEHYLPLMATGEHRGALLLTEPAAGSDLQSITTIASSTDNGYELSGNKIFVTNGDKATVLLTLARTSVDAASGKPRLSLFLLEKAFAGVSVESEFHKMAYGLVDTMEILLQKVQVPASAIVGGQPGLGMRHLLDALEVGRIAIASSAVGLAANALAEAKRYASERSTFGVTIDHHQAVQLRLADMATKLVAARLVTAEAARAKQSGERADMLSGMAKLFASEAAREITEDALRIHGGYGYINEFAVERLYREAPLYIVGEGTNDIQKIVIARRIIDDSESDVLGLPQ